MTVYVNGANIHESSTALILHDLISHLFPTKAAIIAAPIYTTWMSDTLWPRSVLPRDTPEDLQQFQLLTMCSLIAVNHSAWFRTPPPKKKNTENYSSAECRRILTDIAETAEQKLTHTKRIETPRAKSRSSLPIQWFERRVTYPACGAPHPGFFLTPLY